jgi:hypothetical protein
MGMLPNDLCGARDDARNMTCNERLCDDHTSWSSFVRSARAVAPMLCYAMLCYGVVCCVVLRAGASRVRLGWL